MRIVFWDLIECKNKTPLHFLHHFNHILRASLRFEKRLKLSIDCRKLSIFSPFFLNRSEAVYIILQLGHTARWDAKSRTLYHWQASRERLFGQGGTGVKQRFDGYFGRVFFHYYLWMGICLSDKQFLFARFHIYVINCPSRHSCAYKQYILIHDFVHITLSPFFLIYLYNLQNQWRKQIPTNKWRWKSFWRNNSRKWKMFVGGGGARKW